MIYIIDIYINHRITNNVPQIYDIIDEEGALRTKRADPAIFPPR